MTIRDIIIKYSQELEKISDTPRLDVELFLQKALGGVDRIYIHLNLNKELTTEQYDEFIKYINDNFERPIVSTDVGQNQLWTTQFFDIETHRQLLTSGGLGTMGYGFPAAIGAKIGNPERPVIAISGDGGMQMNIQEFATAMVYELPVIVVVFNNGYLGNVRQWQQLFFNKRYSSTCLTYRKSCNRDCMNKDKCCPKYIPDFVKLAESYEARGIRITKEEEIKKAFDYALEFKKGPTLIECVIEREANVSPMVPTGKTLDDMIMDC